MPSFLDSPLRNIFECNHHDAAVIDGNPTRIISWYCICGRSFSMTGKEGNVSNEITHEFLCPFCTKECKAIKKIKEAKVDVFHHTPHCSSFKNMNHVEFMYAAVDSARKQKHG